MTRTEPAPRVRRSRWTGERVSQWVRLALGVAWVVLAVAVTITVGERHGSLEDLRKAVASGRVETVDVTGAGAVDWPRVNQQVHWRDGPWMRGTQVVATAADPDSFEVAITSVEGEPIPRPDAGEYLRELAPDLQVTRDRAWVSRYAPNVVLGFAVPDELLLLVWTLMAAVALPLVLGPAPWRGSRWAWFWICLTGVGIPFVLAFAGPTRFLARPRPDAWRLTGGWCFLLLFALAQLNSWSG